MNKSSGMSSGRPGTVYCPLKQVRMRKKDGLAGAGDNDGIRKLRPCEDRGKCAIVDKNNGQDRKTGGK